MIITANDAITILDMTRIYELAEEYSSKEFSGLQYCNRITSEELAAEPLTSSIPMQPQHEVTSACQASTSSKRTADETVDVDERVPKNR
uniref:Uncharacterized protein n=1 Tax=Ditylenchus dipsaci TaxID=166011 RepID=A0A915DUQ4_9BILA